MDIRQIRFIPMISIVDRQVFAAPSMDFEAIAKIFMLIHIRRHDKSWHAAQVTDFENIITAPPGVDQRYFIGVES